MKNGNNQFGYKNHIDVDITHKLIRSYKVTPASMHDSNVFEELLDVNSSSKDVWADSVYNSHEKLEKLAEQGYREHIQRKGSRSKKLTNREQRGNHTRSKIRSRVEHIFSVQAMQAGSLLLLTVTANISYMTVVLRY